MEKEFTFIDCSKGRLRKVIALINAEFQGTAILVFISCLGLCHGKEAGKTTLLQSSFLGGLTISVPIHIYAHISGAHVNPVISLAALITKEISLSKFPIYVASQLLGGLTGYALVMIVTPDYFLEKANYCVTSPSEYISLTQAVIIESILTAILALAVCSSWDNRNSDKNDSVALRIGLLVAVLSLAAGPFTGAVMNPARSFPPAVFSHNFKLHWVYWLGPTIGAILAASVHRFIFSRS